MTTRRLFLLALTAVCLALAPAGVASAHNSLESSTPADGAVLDTAPPSVLLLFAKPVPLDSVSATLSDPTGVRTDITGFTHGSSDREVVVPLPVLAGGTYSLRWQLVGTDGHIVTDRVGFTVTAVLAVPATTIASPADGGAQPPAPSADEDPPSTPSVLRWLLRYASYVALLAVAALLMVESLMNGPFLTPATGRIVRYALGTIAALAGAQLLVLAGDIEGKWPWAAWSGLGAATETHPGIAFAVRIALCGVAAALIWPGRPRNHDIYLGAMTAVGVGLLATWAFAGHASSLDRPTLGVVLDVAHHGAAAAWMGGLGALVWLGRPNAPDERLATMVPLFSRVALIAVAVLAASGAAQALRLHGGFPDLGTTHGRLLAVKVIGIAAMVALANRNRRSLAATDALRRRVIVEAAWGLLVLGATAALVVSPPLG